MNTQHSLQHTSTERMNNTTYNTRKLKEYATRPTTHVDWMNEQHGLQLTWTEWIINTIFLSPDNFYLLFMITIIMC